MAIGVLLPHLDRGHLGPEAVEQCGQAGIGAAVVGDLHRLHVGQRERDERRALGVPGEEEVEAPGADHGRHRPGVRILGSRPGRPRPRAENADEQAAHPQAHRCDRGHPARAMALRCRHHRAEVAVGRAVAAVNQEVDRDTVDHLREPTVVVAGGVGHHEGRETPNARSPQEADHPPLGRPAIEQHGRAVGVLDEGGVALTDVEEGDGQLARRGGGPQEQGRGHDQGQRRRQRRGGPPRARQPPPPRGRRLARCHAAPGERPRRQRQGGKARVGQANRHRCR